MDKACSGHLHVFVCDVPSFDPFPRPGCLSEKREAGFHAWIMEETADRNPSTHLGPAISLDQLLDDGFQCDSVQWIAGMGGIHERMANGIGVMAEERDNDV